MDEFPHSRFSLVHADESEEKRLFDQNALVAEGNLDAIATYLDPLIEDMLDFYPVFGAKRKLLKELAISEIPRAVRLYQKRMIDGVDYQFATYFTWFAKEKIEQAIDAFKE